MAGAITVCRTQLVKRLPNFRAKNQRQIISNRIVFAAAPTPQSQSTMPEQKCVLKFAKLSEHAFAPTKGSAKAAGYDLRSAYDYTVPGRGKQLVMTDIQVQVPEGCYGRVAPRSGLAVKNFIDVGAGVVDEDYRGNVGVVLFNHAEADFEVKKGDRIAQFICEKIAYPDLQELPSLTDTERGAGGFGSTGTN
ncbi:deoxyuridine 5'-triphosphate nucleotidohydrolase [Anopheles stephensi]|uniref:deoxyuridine 5'-triphosphate nucleotidohydrolase n=1 Tax=Anopheles stephensi TaxID=30069 RepID=UPI001658BC1F|nr:deoxyuridine 5'-triphosphate nucleotidohydrolase [Anopheles stephensi]